MSCGSGLQSTGTACWAQDHCVVIWQQQQQHAVMSTFCRGPTTVCVDTRGEPRDCSVSCVAQEPGVQLFVTSHHRSGACGVTIQCSCACSEAGAAAVMQAPLSVCFHFGGQGGVLGQGRGRMEFATICCLPSREVLVTGCGVCLLTPCGCGVEAHTQPCQSLAAHVVLLVLLLLLHLATLGNNCMLHTPGAWLCNPSPVSAGQRKQNL